MKNSTIALLTLVCVAGCAKTPPPTLATQDVLPRIGLALGGGGARGFAEVGVLRVLEQEKIPIDLVVGTSVGSLIGALYADTGRVLDLEFEAVTIQEEDIFDRSLLSVFSGGLVKGERLESFLNSRLKNKTIETLAVPFAAVATDVRTGQTVVIDKGPVARAVHASSAIPAIFIPVVIDDRTLVDGGVTDPVPADVARRKGADIVIAVAIPAGIPNHTPVNALQVALRAVTVMSAEIGRLRSREADVVLTPNVGSIPYNDFSQKKKLIEAGAAAAREALPEIRRIIAEKTKRVPVAE